MMEICSSSNRDVAGKNTTLHYKKKTDRTRTPITAASAAVTEAASAHDRQGNAKLVSMRAVDKTPNTRGHSSSPPRPPKRRVRWPPTAAVEETGAAHRKNVGAGAEGVNMSSCSSSCSKPVQGGSVRKYLVAQYAPKAATSTSRFINNNNNSNISNVSGNAKTPGKEREVKHAVVTFRRSATVSAPNGRSSGIAFSRHQQQHQQQQPLLQQQQQMYRRARSYTCAAAPFSFNPVCAAETSPQPKQSQQQQTLCTPQQQRQRREKSPFTASPASRAAPGLSPASKKVALLPTRGGKARGGETGVARPLLLLRPPSLRPKQQGTPAPLRGGATSLQPWYMRLASSTQYGVSPTQRERSVATTTTPTNLRNALAAAATRPRAAVRTASVPLFPTSTVVSHRAQSSELVEGRRSKFQQQQQQGKVSAKPKAQHTVTMSRTRMVRQPSGTKVSAPRQSASGAAEQCGKMTRAAVTTTEVVAGQRTGSLGARLRTSSSQVAAGSRSSGLVRTSSVFPPKNQQQQQQQREKPASQVKTGARSAAAQRGASRQKPLLSRSPMAARSTNSTLVREAATRQKERQHTQQQHEQLAAEVQHLPRATWMAMRRELQRLVEVRAKRAALKVESDAAVAAALGVSLSDSGDAVGDDNSRESRPKSGKYREEKGEVDQQQEQASEGTQGSNVTDGRRYRRSRTSETRQEHIRMQQGFSSPYRGPSHRDVAAAAAAATEQKARPVERRGTGPISLPRRPLPTPAAADAEDGGNEFVCVTIPLFSDDDGDSGGGGDGSDKNKDDGCRCVKRSYGNGSRSPSIRPPSEPFNAVTATASSASPLARHTLLGGAASLPLVQVLRQSSSSVASSSSSSSSSSVASPPPKQQAEKHSVNQKQPKAKKKAPALNFCRTRSPRRLPHVGTPSGREVAERPMRRSSSAMLLGSLWGGGGGNIGGGSSSDGAVVLSSDMLVALYATMHGTADHGDANNLRSFERMRSGKSSRNGSLMGRGGRRRSLPQSATTRMLLFSDACTTGPSSVSTAAAAAAAGAGAGAGKTRSASAGNMGANKRGAPLRSKTSSSEVYYDTVGSADTSVVLCGRSVNVEQKSRSHSKRPKGSCDKGGCPAPTKPAAVVKSSGGAKTRSQSRVV